MQPGWFNKCIVDLISESLRDNFCPLYRGCFFLGVNHELVQWEMCFEECKIVHFSEDSSNG